jgi:hypothetical protein
MIRKMESESRKLILLKNDIEGYKEKTLTPIKEN